MPEEDIKKMLREVKESLERSQRMLEAIEEKKVKRAATLPPPPPGSQASGVRHRTRQTAEYDVAYLTSGEPRPRWESGERPVAAPEPAPAATAPSPPPPPDSAAQATDEGRYSIIQQRSSRKPR